MKNILVMLILLSLPLCLFAQSWVAKEYYDTLKHPPIQHAYSTGERDSILTFLQGDWLDKGYYDELIRTKSPMKAQKKGNGWDYLHIFKDEKDSNAFGVYMLAGFHESDLIQFALEKNDSLNFISNTEYHTYHLKIPSLKKYTILCNNSSSEEDYEFVKCDTLQIFVNSVILAGTYNLDNNSLNKQVIFKTDGTIQGLDKIKSYEIGLDFSLGDNDAFSTYDGNDIAWYVFEVLGNSLSIYDGVWTSETSIEKGKLLYKLTKIK
jgi:hypothetical protein